MAIITRRRWEIIVVFTHGALVDDGRLWETAGKAELEFVGWSLTETEAALAAGI